MNKFNQFLNKNLPKNSLLYYYLIRLYYSWKPKYIEIDQVLKNFSKSNDKTFFIQIGSNDGKMQDPIYNYITSDCWNGILIEPVKYLFEKLKENYKKYENQLYFENVAISKEIGTQKFYSLRQTDDPSVPFWAYGLGSFNKDIILKHKMYIPQIEELIVEEELPVTTLAELEKKYNIAGPDVLMIDTEGHDYEILKAYNFDNYKPLLIIYEHRHLSNREYKESISYLKNFGYSLFALECDTIGIHESLMQKHPDLLKDVNYKFPRERVIKMLRFNNSY